MKRIYSGEKYNTLEAKNSAFKKLLKRTFDLSPRKINADEVKNINMCNIIQCGTRDYFVMQVSISIVKFRLLEQGIRKLLKWTATTYKK